MTDETYPVALTELENPVAIFQPEKLDALLAKIRDAVAPMVFDVNDAEGRASIKSIAYKVARSKTAIDDAGKNLVADLKKQSGEIDALRKRARDTLDDLKAEVRKPLTEWEAEQERIEREALEKIEAARRAKEEADAAELAQLRAEKEARDAADRAAEVERARLAREEQIRLEAIEQGKREAMAQQQAPSPPMQAPSPATTSAPTPRYAMPSSVPNPSTGTNVEHQRAVNRAAMQSIVNVIGIDTALATEIVKAIVAGRIPHVSINY